MALRHLNSFDHERSFSGDFLSTIGAFQWWFTGGVGGFLTSPGRFGGSCLNMQLNQFGGSFAAPLDSATVFVGLALYMVPGSEHVIACWDSATQNPGVLGGTGFGNIQACIEVRTDPPRVLIYKGGLNGTPTHLATSPSGIFPVNSWFYLEVKFTIDSVSGSIIVQVQGSPVASFAGDTQFGSVARIDSVGFGNQYPGGYAQIDDLYILDDIAGPGTYPMNDFISALGMPRVFCRFPTGAGLSADFTPLVPPNYSMVQELQMDSDVTYNSDPGTVGHTDLFPATPIPTGTQPLGAQMVGAFRQDNAGLRGMANVLQSGPTRSVGTSQVCFQTYTYQTEADDIYPQDPNDGDWTETTMNNSQIGYQVTG